MSYRFGKLWHLAIIWALRKAFQCILQGVRILLANHTRLSSTSENESYLDSGRKYLVKVRVDIVHVKDVDRKRSQLIIISKACAQTEYNPRIFFKNMQNKSSWIIRWKKTWNLTKEGAEKRMWKPAWLLYHCRALSQHNLVLSHLFEIRKTNKCTQNTSLKRADKSKRYVYFLTLTAKLNARLENRAKYSMTTTMSIREKPRRRPE